MKKNIRKILACILCIALYASCAVPAFAATKETVHQYGAEGGYLAIGDSISRGCGAEGFYIGENGEYLPDGEGQYGAYEMRNVQGCVPYQIAQAVGCTAPMDMTDQDATYWPFTYPGMTTAVTLDLLGVDDGFTDEKLNYAYYKDMLEYFGYEGSFDGVRDGDTVEDVTASRGGVGKCGNVIELIERSDLITVQLGMCDIFYRAYRIVSNGGMLADGLKFDLSSTDAIKALLETAVSEMRNGYNYWKGNYPKLIETIQRLNPDATIVIVGAFNIVGQLTIMDELPIPIGNIISGITDSMNVMYRQWAEKYGVLYADISNTETLSAENDWSILGDFKDNTFTGTHPSQTGYDYIVRQILAQLPPTEKHENIVVDLGRFDKVDSVKIDGKEIEGFEMNGFELSVPCSDKYAMVMTVSIKNEDGTTGVQIYTIHYDEEQGFTADREWGNNDLQGTLLAPLSPILNWFYELFQKIVNAIRSLFGKA